MRRLDSLPCYIMSGATSSSSSYSVEEVYGGGSSVKRVRSCRRACRYEGGSRRRQSVERYAQLSMRRDMTLSATARALYTAVAR
ncbi:hypothetical protein MRB53_038468 [Persea americana]|nr:hypothetical protein MRB53_038468 [Persea americana]